MDIKLIIAIVIGVIVVAIMIELWLKRGKSPRPLAERMKTNTRDEEKPLLGMEETDLEIVEQARKKNALAALTSETLHRKHRRH